MSDDSLKNGTVGEIIRLPKPRFEGDCPIEDALRKRRSVREFLNKSLSLDEISQLLWSAQGITDPEGLRTAPSAGALYPLEVYLVAGDVETIPGGIYRYKPDNHSLSRIVEGDWRSRLASASLGQDCVRGGAVIVVIAAVYERLTGKYMERGRRYADMEVGHAGQNVSLQAISLGLGTVMVGAFDDQKVKRLLQMPDDEQPLYLIPVGRVR
jgi:SagB-type dehydrogenase family enzyme